uniref:Uncharacterized protein n=1 Tax=Fagus sylvatica TaxID=28930 RepID=A0A2N9HB69_FAGSY
MRRRGMVPRELWYCHVAVLSFHASSSSNPPRFPCAYLFLPDFRGQFWRSSGTQNGSCGISSESSRRPLSNDIKFARNRSSDEGVMAPGSRGVGAVFVHFSDADSGQTGDAIGEPRVPRRSWSHYLSNAPGLADQLVASRKDSAREGGCPGGKNAFCSQRVFSQILSQFARIFDLAPDVRISTFLVPSESLRCLLLQGSGFTEIRAWTCEIWPREQRPPEVFLVRLRAVFRSGFRLAPINSWRSESSLSCMNVSSFQRARARGSTCCESGRLCAQAWQRRWENSGTFSKTLFRRPVFTRVVDVAPDVGFRRSWYRRKAYATYFSKGTGLAQRRAWVRKI